MLRSTISKVIWFLVAVVVAGNLGIYANWLRQRMSPPYKYVAGWVVPDKSRAGEKLEVHFIFERYRYCETSLDRFITREADGLVVYRERFFGGATPIGRHEARNHIVLPGDLEPGWYLLTYSNFAQCPDGIHTTFPPVIRFEVIP